MNRFFTMWTKPDTYLSHNLHASCNFWGVCWNAALLVTFSSGQLISFQIAVADAALKVRTTSNPYWLHNCHFRCKACSFCTGIRNKYAPIKLYLNQVCACYGHIWGIWWILMATFSKIVKILFSWVFFARYSCNVRWPITKKKPNRQFSKWNL